MVRVPADVAAARARWLAELSEALDEAQALLSRLEPAELWRIDALDLSARVEAAQAHVRMLQSARRIKAPEPHPEWRRMLPWDRAVGCTG
jgi:hypothetical protein